MSDEWTRMRVRERERERERRGREEGNEWAVLYTTLAAQQDFTMFFFNLPRP